MSILKQLAEYLYLKKKDDTAPKSDWLKYMHGMNRISLIMGIIAVIIVLIRLFVKR
jgi:hypothetical protein